jgi:hypothetical protein
VHDWLEVLQSRGRVFKSGLVLYSLFPSWSYALEWGAQASRGMVQVFEHCVSRSWLGNGNQWHICDRVAPQCVIKVSLRCEFIREGFGFEVRASMVGSAQSELRTVSCW